MYFICILLICMVLIKGETVYNLNARPRCENVTGYHLEPGYQPHPTIIGGYVAKQHEFPFALRLYIRTVRKVAFCTAQALTPRLVISAAHCVQYAYDVVIVGGKADHTDYIRGVNLHQYARYRAKEVFVHPDFDRGEYRHDVAVIKTGRPMIHPGHGFVRISFDKLNESVSATIYGWGETEKHVGNHLLFGKHLHATNCTAKMGGFECYPYVCLMEKGICHGDSGGGLLVDGVMYGVASFFSDSEDNCSPEKFRYYYASLWAEKQFLTDCIEKNGSNYNRFFFNITWVFLFYLFIQ